MPRAVVYEVPVRFGPQRVEKATTVSDRVTLEYRKGQNNVFWEHCRLLDVDNGG